MAVLDETTSTMQLRPVDPITGINLSEHPPIDLGSTFSYLWPRKQNTLVVTRYATSGAARGELHFIDLPGWKDDFAIILLSARRTASLAISPDGHVLAVSTERAQGGSLWLVDLGAHVVLAHVDTRSVASQVKFTSDSQGLMTYEHPDASAGKPYEGPPMVSLRSTQDLTIQWSRSLAGLTDGFLPGPTYAGDPNEPGTGNLFQPAVVFSPIANRLYIVQANVDRLTKVDFDRKSVLTLDIHKPLSLLDRWPELGVMEGHALGWSGTQLQAQIAADESAVYTAGFQSSVAKQAGGGWLETRTPLAIRAIRLKNAAEIYESSVSGTSLELASDGSVLLAPQVDGGTGAITGTTEVEAGTGVAKEHFPGLSLHLSNLIDGTPILVSASPDASNASATRMTSMGVNGELLGSWVTLDQSAWLLER